MDLAMLRPAALKLLALSALLGGRPSVSTGVGEPHGRCTWSNGVPEQVLDALAACDGGDRTVFDAAEAAFGAHRRAHGWAGRRDDADFVPPERAARCPASALDLLERCTVPAVGLAPATCREEVAACLARNDRVESAFALLDAQIAEERMSGDDAFVRDVISRTSAAAAGIAADAGRWERALAFAADWHPMPGCGESIRLEFRDIDTFRMRCRVELGRWQEVREGCLRRLDLHLADCRVTEAWIDSFVRAGEPLAPEDAIELLAGFAPSYEEGALRGAVQDWRVLQMSPADRMEHFLELGGAHVDVLIAEARELSDARICELAAPLFSDATRENDYAITTLLAASGHRAAGPVLELAIARLRKTQEKWYYAPSLETWRKVRAQLDELSKG